MTMIPDPLRVGFPTFSGSSPAPGLQRLLNWVRGWKSDTYGLVLPIPRKNSLPSQIPEGPGHGLGRLGGK